MRGPTEPLAQPPESVGGLLAWSRSVVRQLESFFDSLQGDDEIRGRLITDGGRVRKVRDVSGTVNCVDL